MDLSQISILHENIIRIQNILILCQEDTVLCHHALSGKYQILGGLRPAGGSISINAAADCRLMLDQPPAIGTFPHSFIGSRQIDNHFRTVQTHNGGRRQRCPEILTDFHSHKRSITDPEQQIPSHRNFHIFTQSQQFCRNRLNPEVRRRGEPAALIELIVIGKIGLGNKAMELAIGNNRSAIIHLAFQNHRRTNNCSDMGVLRTAIHDFLKAVHAGFQKCILEKEIFTGIARQSQFRKHHQIAACYIRLPEFCADIFHIFLYVTNTHRRYRAGDTNKIQHRKPSITFLSGSIITHPLRFEKRNEKRRRKIAVFPYQISASSLRVDARSVFSQGRSSRPK